ncbi:LURP-one-related family protein [Streptococcus pluranimalium]|uniref:LURP-one-related family protein n=1 Tax=Streptococcus pluranimalium TaxID=82348 RepID=UPI0039FBDDEB
MKFYLKQTSLFKNNFEIRNEDEELVYLVKGNVGGFVGLRSSIHDAKDDSELATIRQRFSQYKFDIKKGDQLLATVKKKWLALRTTCEIDGVDWQMTGKFLKRREYDIVDKQGQAVARVSQNLSFKDSFEVDIANISLDPVLVLGVVLSLDAVIDQSK